MEDKMDKKINEENLDKVSGGCDIDDTCIAHVHIKGTPGGNALGIKPIPLEKSPTDYSAYD